MKVRRHYYFAPVLALAIAAFPAWAAEATAPGVPNFHQVDNHIYRGGQPNDNGWQSLSKLGVKTVIDLRHDSRTANAEKHAVESAGMRYISVPMNGILAPPDEQIHKVLSLLDAAADGLVFVHCRRGADRTGTVIACYRMTHDHWRNQKALDEAKSLGMSWTEVGMKRYILNFHAPLEQTASATNVPAPATAAAKP